MSYEKQLAFKEQKVYNNLKRIGGVPEELLKEVMEPIIGMVPEDWNTLETGCEVPVRYRNKAQFPFGVDKEGKTVCGFYAGRTHDIVANTDCRLGTKENETILKAVLSYMEECHVKPYSEVSGEGVMIFSSLA